jgi:hypothetical protein
MPIAFGADPPSVPYPSVIVEVTPAEYEQILAGSLLLPHAWQLGATIYPPPAGAMRTWAEAFAVQAGSDLDAYEQLCRPGVRTSHRLHYLQMWLEKLCKAYLWLPRAADDLRMRHQVVEKVLPRMISEH